jgi:hypothetical protein
LRRRRRALAQPVPGVPGPHGSHGPTGPAGEDGEDGQTPSTPGSSAGLLSSKITSITINQGALKVEFEIKDKAGNPVSLSSTAQVEFGISKLLPRTDARPMYWQSLVQYSTGTDGATQTRVLRPTTERASMDPNATSNNRPMGDIIPVAGKPGTYSYSFCTNLVDVGTFKYYGNTGARRRAVRHQRTGWCDQHRDGTAAKDILAAMDLSFDPPRRIACTWAAAPATSTTTRSRISGWNAGNAARDARQSGGDLRILRRLPWRLAESHLPVLQERGEPG